MYLRRTLLLLCLCLSFVAACGDTEDTSTTPNVDELTAVSPGKADNYYSNVAAEYELTGTISVEMTADEFADKDVQAARIGERLTAVGLYLTTYLTDKFRGIDHSGDGEISDDEIFFYNDGYGGFQAMVRNYSLETEGVTEISNGLYEVTFTIDVAGPYGLLDALPGDFDAAAGAVVFKLQMPKGRIVTDGDVPRTEIRRFDPEEYTGDLEDVLFYARQLPDVSNAYPHYAEFMEDGLYDITLFFGHDYNESRSDLREAEQAFNALESMGFKAPVADFGSLNHESGPFEKEMIAHGKTVQVKVRIFHSDMFKTNRSVQHDLALSEVAARDVFFYNGHAGPYYGFYLDANGEAKVDYKEFEDYPMQGDRQQMVVAQGCQTYSQYADFIYANPVKSEANLDVITTVNYSYGRGTLSILRSLLKVDRYGNHSPVAYYTIIRDLNREWLNAAKDVMYGVMGIDGNPQMHPYVNREALGEACTTSLDCGEPDAHHCVDPGDGVKQCAGSTLSEFGCPNGTIFKYVASSNTIVGGACFKADPSDLVYGFTPNSADANTLLEFVNSASLTDLDDAVKLDARAAKNIIDYRHGLDGQANTADDNPIDSLEELDSISWVSTRAFAKLKTHLDL